MMEFTTVLDALLKVHGMRFGIYEKRNRQYQMFREWIIEYSNGAEMLRQQISDLQQYIAKEPFYWTRPEGYPAEQCAEDGWYQWTPRGLVYLGTTAELTINETEANDETHKI